jgi:carbon-monoxide dehydrogenase medium subunit
MKPARFDYARPATLEEALALLAAHGPEASVLAGGQSLMPMLALRVARPALLVDIGRIPGLDGIAAGPDGAVRLGARARHAAVLASAEVPALLAQALPHVAHPAIRNRGTFGGSLALADPAAELPACAICLDAVLVAASAAGGERRIRASDFFRSAYATALRPEELLLRAEIPDPAGWRFGFAEVARRHGDYALAGMALAIRPGAVGGIAEARIVPFGLEAAPRRIGAAEQALAEEGIEAAVMALRAALDPMESPEAPAAWRRHLAGTVLRRALAMAEGGPHGHHP